MPAWPFVLALGSALTLLPGGGVLPLQLLPCVCLVGPRLGPEPVSRPRLCGEEHALPLATGIRHVVIAAVGGCGSEPVRILGPGQGHVEVEGRPPAASVGQVAVPAWGTLQEASLGSLPAFPWSGLSAAAVSSLSLIPLDRVGPCCVYS